MMGGPSQFSAGFVPFLFFCFSCCFFLFLFSMLFALPGRAQRNAKRRACGGQWSVVATEAIETRYSGSRDGPSSFGLSRFLVCVCALFLLLHCQCFPCFPIVFPFHLFSHLLPLSPFLSFPPSLLPLTDIYSVPCAVRDDLGLGSTPCLPHNPTGRLLDQSVLGRAGYDILNGK